MKSVKELAKGTTKGDLANEIYKGMTFDVSVPQDWLNSAVDKLGCDYGFFLSGVVWLYEQGSLWGSPAPLTTDHRLLLAQLGSE